MKERPILFSAPMVRAILEGRKTQTRRVVKQVLQRLGEGDWYAFDHKGINYRVNARHITVAAWAHLLQFSPYGQTGDRLWVREAWRHTASSLDEARAITEDITSGIAVDWRATYIDNCMNQLGFSREEAEMADDFEIWRPSIHMPRWASRILLEVTGVRVERLNDISESDSLAEGVTFQTPVKPSRAERMARDAYADLWESINGADSWCANPWVWVIEFKQLKGE